MEEEGEEERGRNHDIVLSFLRLRCSRRPPESDVWRAAYSQEYTRWYWWRADLAASGEARTTWDMPETVALLSCAGLG